MVNDRFYDSSDIAEYTDEADLLLGEKDMYLVENLLENKACNVPVEPVKNKNNFVSPILYYIAAIIIVVVIVIAGFLRFKHQQESIICADLFSKHYSLLNFKYEANAIETSFGIAFEAFSKNNFEQAIELFDNAISENPLYFSSWLYKGIAGIETGQYKKAMEAFNVIIQAGSNPLYEHAQWYMAMTWLKLNNGSAAIPYLQALSETKSEYKSRSAEIIQNLTAQ